MLASLKSEFRKLLTVRTTYGITLLTLLFISLIAFYFEGWRLHGAALHDPNQLAGDVTGALNLAILGAIVAILLMTHEYRYNTIMYTLTASNSRNKVLLSKFIVVSLYALLLTAAIAVLSPLMSYLGVHAHGNMLAPQVLQYRDLAWRSLFYGWGYGMAGLLLALLTRNQIGSIVTVLIVPSVIENLVGFLILKHNSVYMPFSALSQVLNGPSPASTPTSSTISSAAAAGVYCIYLAAGGVAAWVLFQKRDAN